MKRQTTTESRTARQLAYAGVTLHRHLPLADLERAHSLLHGHDGVLEATLNFSVDESGVSVLTGEIKVETEVLCQRCMEPLSLPIHHQFEMGMVDSEEEENRLPPHYEPLLVDETPFPLQQFIEDELILSIPVVATHPPEQCSASPWLQDETPVDRERENPFEVLRQLKSTPE